ncbi:vitamin K epoxide reductase family protein [Nocardia sp. MW-W600-9]
MSRPARCSPGWLIFQALYRIGSLCPYCMVVWAMMPALLALLTRPASGRAPGPIATIVGWRWTVAVLMYAVVILLVFLRFQDYWLSLW